MIVSAYLDRPSVQTKPVLISDWAPPLLLTALASRTHLLAHAIAPFVSFDRPMALCLHSNSVLGMAAFIGAHPYDVPQFMPELLCELGDHIGDPVPIQVLENVVFFTRSWALSQSSCQHAPFLGSNFSEHSLPPVG